jgi:ADP-ribose pyrophosphatase YjhB (NUDIX family)
MTQTIKVGVGVMIIDNDKILLGHRVPVSVDTGGIYEPDCWTLPGGKQEYEETIYEAAIRECKEETNLDISELSVFTASDSFQPDRHYVTINFITNTYSGELQIMEPDKIDKWEWFNINDLPKNIYSPSKHMIDEYINKNN